MEAESENNRHPLIDIMMDLTVALTNNNEEDALAAADRFYQSVCSSQNISSSQVRDLYFKYLVKLDEISMSNHISLWQSCLLYTSPPVQIPHTTIGDNQDFL